MAEHPGSETNYRNGCRCDNCKSAHSERNIVWRAENSVKVAASNAAYRKRNPGYYKTEEQKAKRRARYARRMQALREDYDQRMAALKAKGER